MQDVATAQENTEGMYTQTKHREQTTGGNDQQGNQRSCDHIRKVTSKQRQKTQDVGGQQGQNEGRFNSVYKQFMCGLYSKLICASSKTDCWNGLSRAG